MLVKSYFTDQDYIDIYNQMYERGTMWFMLASLISAENFWEIGKSTKEDDYNKLVAKYNENMNSFQTIGRVIGMCDKIPEKRQQEIRAHALKGFACLQDELQEVKEKWNKLKNNNI